MPEQSAFMNTCFCCDRKFIDNQNPHEDPLGCWDEGDLWWCLDCIYKWEQDKQAHWGSGQPFKQETE